MAGEKGGFQPRYLNKIESYEEFAKQFSAAINVSSGAEAQGNEVVELLANQVLHDLVQGNPLHFSTLQDRIQYDVDEY